MISVSNLSKNFGEQDLFEGVSFQLNPGERYGLVGANGSGKTTLLGILSGDVEPSAGTVSIPKSLRLGVLRQDHFLYEGERIIDVALMGNHELWEAMVEKDALLARAHEHFDGERFSVLEETIQRLDGYAAEARAAEILEGLGLPAEVHEQPLSTLSGGFKLRVLLAQVLAGAPDVLLLDEPTNHLDIDSIRWLEGFLQDFEGLVVVISHDHRFLDTVATGILDVDYQTVTLYRGNYSTFVEQKREDRERREKEIATRQKEIAHHQQFVDRFRAKSSKARQAQSKLRIIEKKASELVELPGSSRRYPKFRFEQRRPSGREVLRLEGVRKSFGEKEVLHGVDLEVRRGEKVVIIGPNGIGKSTLLKIAIGALEPDAGEVEWGHETYPGYFAQDHRDQLDDVDQTAEDWLWSFCPGKERGFVRGQLGLMLFTGSDGEKRVGALSGGEAARLVFARIMVEKPNVLVLDEPTNHLDLESIEALVVALRDYDGTLILVSHDRWFVSQIATRVVEIRQDGIRDYHGTYDEFVRDHGDDHLDAQRRSRKNAHTDSRGRGAGTGRGNGAGPRGRRDDRSRGAGQRGDAGRNAGADQAEPRPLSPRQRRELEARLDEVTAEIEQAEARVAEIDALFSTPGFFDETPPDSVQELTAERTRRLDHVEALMTEWEEIEERLES